MQHSGDTSSSTRTPPAAARARRRRACHGAPASLRATARPGKYLPRVQGTMKWGRWRVHANPRAAAACNTARAVGAAPAWAGLRADGARCASIPTTTAPLAHNRSNSSQMPSSSVSTPVLTQQGFTQARAPLGGRTSKRGRKFATHRLVGRGSGASDRAMLPRARTRRGAAGGARPAKMTGFPSSSPSARSRPSPARAQPRRRTHGPV